MLRKQYKGTLKRTAFPPRPLSQKEVHRIITRYCVTVKPSQFIEKGCAVCGRLNPLKHLSPLT
ncbi:hypothetical protein B0H16DRAFT_1345956, partial [Mycena metata]